jgi:hypothetical protein
MKMGIAGIVMLILTITSLILVSIQTERTFVESCVVVVRDRSGQAAQGVRVSESWDAYSYELSGGGDLWTDESGQVYFPKGAGRHTMLFWLLRPIVNRLYYGVHAGYGIYANIHISQPGEQNPNGFSCSGKKCSEHPIELQFQVAWR